MPQVEVTELSDRTQVAVVAAAVGSFVVPLAILVWASFSLSEVPEELRAPTEPVLVRAEIREFDMRQPVSLELAWDRPEPVRAPSWPPSGVVTEVFVRDGETIHDGDPLLSVNGVRRLAVSTSMPFWRPIAESSEGEDVLELERALTRLGYLASGDRGAVDGEMMVSIRQLGADLGVDGEIEAFDPAWFVWTEDAETSVSQVLVKEGQRSPSVGAAILERPQFVTEVAFRSSVDNRPLELDTTSTWVFESPGISLTINPDEPSEMDLAALSSLIPAGTDQLTGTIALSMPTLTTAVPNSAIVFGGTGATCVIVQIGQEYSAQPVEVLDSVGGAALLSSATDGEYVVANPIVLGDNLTCD